MNLLYAFEAADAQNLSFFTDNQNIGIQNIWQNPADIIEDHFAGIVIMQKLVDFSCFV